MMGTACLCTLRGARASTEQLLLAHDLHSC